MDDATLLRLVADNWNRDWPGSTTPDRLRAIAERIDERPAPRQRREAGQ